MKKWAVGLSVAGALWMIVVLTSGSLFLAEISNYPGVFSFKVGSLQRIAPLQMTVWTFNVWLVLTGATECAVVGLTVRAMVTRFFA